VKEIAPDIRSASESAGVSILMLSSFALHQTLHRLRTRGNEIVRIHISD